MGKEISLLKKECKRARNDAIFIAILTLIVTIPIAVIFPNILQDVIIICIMVCCFSLGVWAESAQITQMFEIMKEVKETEQQEI